MNSEYLKPGSIIPAGYDDSFLTQQARSERAENVRSYWKNCEAYSLNSDGLHVFDGTSVLAADMWASLHKGETGESFADAKLNGRKDLAREALMFEVRYLWSENMHLLAPSESEDAEFKKTQGFAFPRETIKKYWLGCPTAHVTDHTLAGRLSMVGTRMPVGILIGCLWDTGISGFKNDYCAGSSPCDSVRISGVMWHQKEQLMFLEYLPSSQ